MPLKLLSVLMLLALGACTTVTSAKPKLTGNVPPTDRERLASLFETPLLPASPLDKLMAPFITTPDDLVGKEDVTLYRLLGKPRMVRHESPAQVWQFHGDTCIIDFFLYREAGPFVVTHAQARKNGLKTFTPEDCLDQVIAKRSSGLTS